MTRWTEVNEARYDEMLGVVPPVVYLTHGFLVGEPWRHNDDGQPLFGALVRYRHCGYGEFRYYESLEPMTLREFRALNPQEAELDIVAEYAREYFERLGERIDG